jgi:DNA topoisomerase I
VSSGDVNDYLRAAAGIDVTAKDYRTWMGTLLAASALAAVPHPTSNADARRKVAAAIKDVSDELGNTPAVCRASYVHPGVVAAYEDATLPDRWDAASSDRPRGLLADERRLLGVLRSLRRSPSAGSEELRAVA